MKYMHMSSPVPTFCGGDMKTSMKKVK